MKPATDKAAPARAARAAKIAAAKAAKINAPDGVAPQATRRLMKYHRSDFEWQPDIANEIPTHIDPDKLRQLERDGYRLQWVTTHVYGQEQKRNISIHERGGWLNVERGDELAQWLEVEPTIDGLQLMIRPVDTDDEARQHERRKASAVVQTKREGLLSGAIPGVTLDSRHVSARRTSKINRSYKRLEIPGGDEE
jgi:hypothetical protein